MAGDFNKPALADTYTLFASSVRDLFADMSKGLDPALSLNTANIPTNAIRWSSASGYWEKYNGAVWSQLASTYAINVNTANAWSTGRTITLTSDVTGASAAWTGSGNISFSTTLASVITAAGPIGSATSVPVITVDAKGRVTALSSASIGTMAAQSAVTFSIGAAGSAATLDLSNTASVIKIPQSTTQAPTDEGSIGWDTNNDVLVIGDGAGTKVISPDNIAATLYNKTLDATCVFPTLNQNTTGSSASVSGSGVSTVGTLKFSGEGGNSGQAYNSYAIYQEAGTWSHPYPDLIIGFHTGIKIGALSSYGGVRFYNNAPAASGNVELFSIGNGDDHVRCANNLYITGTLYTGSASRSFIKQSTLGDTELGGATGSTFTDIFVNGSAVSRYTAAGLAVTGTVTGSNLSGTNTGDQTSVSGSSGSVYSTSSFTSSAITGLTSAPMSRSDINVGVTPSYIPMTHQTAVYNSGYRTHCNTGLFKSTSGWTGSWYCALGGNDSYPTEAFYLNYGGVISHSSGIVTLNGNATYAANSSKLYSTDGIYAYGSGAPYYGYLTYTGARWRFQVSPATPAAVEVAYADSSGNAATATNAAGAFTVPGALTIGNTTSSDIYMVDTDEGTRRIHCNSHRIGFLTQADNWGAYCDDSGNWYANNLSGTNTGDNTTATALVGNGAPIYGTTVGESYSNLPQVRERNAAGAQGSSQTIAPGLGFHWSGVVASSIQLEASGRISIRNNPGTSYEAFVCAALSATTGSFSSTISASNFSGSSSGTNTGDQTTVSGSSGSCTGNAATATSCNYSNSWFGITANYGHSVEGVYNSTLFQGLYGMGSSYRLGAGGTVGNLYGMTWSYPSAGGAAGNLASHGFIVLINGAFASSMSSNIVASGNITAYSDDRLKENWQPMPDNYLEKLAKVKVGIYDRTDLHETQVGVSAQSLEPVLPPAVTTSNDDMKTKHVSYGNAALASAVMLARETVELRKMIEQLQQEVNLLKGKQ